MCRTTNVAALRVRLLDFERSSFHRSPEIGIQKLRIDLWFGSNSGKGHRARQNPTRQGHDARYASTFSGGIQLPGSCFPRRSDGVFCQTA